MRPAHLSRTSGRLPGDSLPGRIGLSKSSRLPLAIFQEGSMKTSFTFCLSCFCHCRPLLWTKAHARDLGGTVPGITAGVEGQLDTTSENSLTFEQAGNKLSIPYASIQSYEYSTEVTRHLGVLPVIAVGLMKMRRRSHFFRFSYRDGHSAVQQIAV